MSNSDYFLVYQQTPHGKRYWDWYRDPLTADDVVFTEGPFLVGDEGYSSLDSAFEAVQGDPAGWVEGTWDGPSGG